MELTRSLAILAALTLVATAPRAAAQESDRNLRVFFDCNAFCDGNYIRLETPWVDFVRDRTDADVHLLITSLRTGAGGERYTLSFVGQGAFAGRSDTLSYVHTIGETDDVRRRGLTRTIQLGLGPYVAETPAGVRIRMELDERTERAAGPSAGEDAWNSWVFDLNAHGGLEGEERQSEFEWGGSVDARRITSRWKVGASADAFFNESEFTIEDDSGGAPQEITTIRESYSGGAVVVRSHGPHWGSGFQVSVGASTFSNTELSIRAAPAIEFSFFPYDEFTRRQLILQYSAGVSAFRYREETIFGKVAETRPTHALVLGYDLTEPWGQVEVTLETSRYMDNSAQWRFSSDGELEVRITRGLSIDIGARASLIRDQLAIPKRGATPEEILLELRELQSDYRYDARVGLSYTFGSIFSSVVNPRFGTGPGQVLP